MGCTAVIPSWHSCTVTLSELEAKARSQSSLVLFLSGTGAILDKLSVYNMFLKQGQAFSVGIWPVPGKVDRSLLAFPCSIGNWNMFCTDSVPVACACITWKMHSACTTWYRHPICAKPLVSTWPRFYMGFLYQQKMGAVIELREILMNKIELYTKLPLWSEDCFYYCS